MNDIKKDLTFLRTKILPFIDIEDGITEVSIDEGDFVVSVDGGEPIAALNKVNNDEFYYSIFFGLIPINELFKHVGLDRKLKLL